MTITITLLVLALGAFGLERQRRAGKAEIARLEALEQRIDEIARRHT